MDLCKIGIHKWSNWFADGAAWWMEPEHFHRNCVLCGKLQYSVSYGKRPKGHIIHPNSETETKDVSQN